MNAFAELGIEERLVVSDEELRAALREAAKRAHPDAGGDETAFANVREAYAVLASPSRRLQHWMERRGRTLETRGEVDSRWMDLFGAVGEAMQRAEQRIRQREEARSALARALLEGEVQRCREDVERLLGEVQERLDAECEAFREMESGADWQVDAIAKVARNLAFLEKWRTGLRSCFSRLA